MKKHVKLFVPSIAKTAALGLLLASTGPLLTAQVQSQLWTIPGSAITFPSTTASPTLMTNLPSGGGDYNPSVRTNNPSNCYYDQNKNLLFFIVDGMVYDGSGYSIGPVEIQNSGTYPVTGTTEFVIIPVPGACKKFYLVAGAYTNPSQWFTGGSPAACYITLDMNSPHNPNTYSPAVIGDSRATGNLTTQYATQLVTPLTPAGSRNHNGSIHLGVTPLQLTKAGENRLLFVSDSYGIYSFVVDITGIHPAMNGSQQQGIGMLNTTASGGARNELEVVKTSVGNYRVAVGYVQNNSSSTICITEFSSSGAPVTGSTVAVALPNNGPSGAPCITKGLEFSPDTKTLYVAHEYPPYLEYIDLSNYNTNYSQPGLLPLPNPYYQNNYALYHLSQIELGYDGKLYFACIDAGNQGIATFTNPNSPGTGVFATQTTTLNGVNVPKGLGVDPNSTSDQWLALLPDQIDAENYQLLWNTVTVSPNPSTICAGSCINLSYTSSNNDQVGVTYWYNGSMHSAGPYTPTNNSGNFGNWCPATTQIYTATPIVPSGSGYCVVPTNITINVTQKISPYFTLVPYYSSDPNQLTFTMHAIPNQTSFPPLTGMYWDVQEVSESFVNGSPVYTPILGTDLNSSMSSPMQWWYSNDNWFPGYKALPPYNTSNPSASYSPLACPGGANCASPAQGTFFANHHYRVTFADWVGNDPCNPWNGSSVVVTGCPACKSSNNNGGFEIVEVPFTMTMPEGLLTGMEQKDIKATGPEGQPDFLISPNPSNGLVNISLSKITDEKTTVTIYNCLGQQIEQREVVGTEQNISFELGGKPKGLYLVKMSTGNKETTKKLILN